MNNFAEAYNKTMKHEGGYVHDPYDLGGETYKGISRSYNPSWEGWDIIDVLKTEANWPDSLKDNLDLDVLKLDKSTKSFYKSRYFNPFKGDDMSVELATEMFDTAVNMGVGRAVKFLQTALNVLNRDEKLYKDMVEDGDYGQITHSCLSIYLTKDTEHLLLKLLNVLQGNHYISYMKKSPVQERYARGWFTRVSISKT